MKYTKYMLSLLFIGGFAWIGLEASNNGKVNGNEVEEYDELDELDDEIGALSLYKRGEELGPYLVGSARAPGNGIWIFAAEKNGCSSFVVAPSHEAMKEGIEVAFFWHNNTADHPHYATSVKGGFVNDQEKWYPFDRMFYVKYDDAKHSSAGTSRHHNFQMKFRRASNSKLLSDGTADQRKYVRFLASTARPVQLPGEFDGGKGDGNPFYSSDELAVLVAKTDALSDESYSDVKALQVSLGDLDHLVESGQFTAEEVTAELERQEEGIESDSLSEDEVGSSAILASAVAAALTAGKKVGSKIVDKTLDQGIEFVASGVVGFFKKKLEPKCLSTGSINPESDITKVYLHGKMGW